MKALHSFQLCLHHSKALMEKCLNKKKFSSPPGTMGNNLLASSPLPHSHSEYNANKCTFTAEHLKSH